MKFGSVCSGIEAASVAWHPLGWEAAWLSEIEPFPCALLAHHYPSVPNLGNMTSLPDRIRSGEVEAPDLFCGGTPCQAFSVAGLRHSLDDARGNLSLTFCEIADAIDSVRTTPSIVFWENVPGVLNTKDNAFGCFLGALAGEDDALIPPGGRWANAGFVDGAKRAVAWRILDAQYFGVAQRRRRVFVIASARDDFDPAAVLFEFDGVRRDTAPSREKRQEVAGTITRSAFSGSAGGRPEGAAGNHFVAQTWPAEIATTLDAHFGDKQGLEDQHINGGVPCLSLCLTSGTGKRYDAETETLIPTNGGHFVDAIKQPVTYDFFNITAPVNRQSRTPGDPCHTLARSNAEHAVVMGPLIPTNGGHFVDVIAFHHNAQVCQLPNSDRDTSISDSLTCSQQAAAAYGICDDETVMADCLPTMPTPSASGGGHPPAVAFALQHAQIGRKDSAGPQGKGWQEGLAFTQDSRTCADAVAVVMQATQPIGFDAYNNDVTGDVSKTIDTGQDYHHVPNLLQAMQVRRLTPRECERLQGFPDDYTDIKPKGKPTPDGPRYKALGNSWAVPVVRWIGKRIANELA